MSPEHLSGKVVPQSDIFSLGGVLTYASTGHGPFDAATNNQIEMRILNHPPDLGQLTGEPREIISTCLEKNPANRPTLRDLLTRFSGLGSSGDPVYQPTVTIPGKHGLSLLAPPLAAHDTTVTRIAFSPDGRRLATADRNMTVALWDTATWTLVGPPVPISPREANYNSQGEISFTPDSQLLTSITYHGVDGDSKGWHQVNVWNAADLSLAHTPYELLGTDPRISPDGRHIVRTSNYEDPLPRIWDITGTFSGPRALEATGQGDSSYRDHRVAFSPDGRFAADHGDDVRLWDLTTGALMPASSAASEFCPISDIAISPRGGLLALSSRVQPSIRIIEVAAGESAKARIVHEGAANYDDPVFSPDGCMLACLVGGRGGEIDVVWIWDPATGRPVDIITFVSAIRTRLLFSPDSRFLAAGIDSVFAIRDTVARRTIRTPKETGDPGFQAIAFSANSSLLASSERSHVRIWRLPDA
jgi:WD40 repeat protein